MTRSAHDRAQPVMDDRDRDPGRPPRGTPALVASHHEEGPDLAEQSRDRLCRALEAAGLVGSWEWDIEDDLVRANPTLARLFGLDPDAAARGLSLDAFLGGVHPQDRDSVRAAIEQALVTGEEYRSEYRVAGLDGELRWVTARGRCERDSAGRPVRFPGILIDITERRQAELALQESEARLEAIVDSVDQMIWSTRPDGFHDYYNARWYEFTGVPEGSTDGEGWNGLFHPEDQERAWAGWRHSLATGEPYHIEYRLRHRSGQYRWVIGRAQPMRDATGRITRWYGTCTDIHDLKQAEEARDLIARELQHRIKNIFALVSSLVALSARDAPEAKLFAAHLQARFSALARAHDAISPAGAPGLVAGPKEQTLQGVFRLVLAPYEEAPGQRIDLAGDDLRVEPQQATALALLVHELVTNAVKHGSLTAPEGRVRIRCAASPEIFRIVWEEQGGPGEPPAPERRGFGTLLTDRVAAGQLGARLTRDWRPQGLVVTVEVPLADLAGGR